MDLRALVLPIASDQVTVSAPAQAVRLEKTAAGELTSAIRAALDNVRRHCGEQARAWVLVEDEPGLVTVTVRDDGPGIADGRLAEAAAAGRLGEPGPLRRRCGSGSGTLTGSAAEAGRASRPSPAAWRPGTAYACTRPTR